MDRELDTLIEAHKNDVHAAPEHAVQRWHSAIDEAAALERGRQQQPAPGWHPTSFFWGMAVTAAMAIGIGIGFLMSNENGTPNDVPPRVAVNLTPQSPVPAAFVRGLRVHLRDSRELLTTAGNEAGQAALILRVIDQNRMFEAAAELNNAPKLARVLRAFEPILLRLAATDIAPEDAQALRAQLAFELNVMLTKLARESSDDSQTT